MPGMVLCVSEKEENITFGCIKFIIQTNNEYAFVYNKIQTVFRYHEYAYDILGSSQSFEVINYKNVFNSRSTDVICVLNQKFVLLPLYL